MTDPQNPGAQPPAYEPPATPPAYETPAYPAAPPAAPAYAAGGYGAPAAPVPGKTLGIVALVLALVPVGLQLVGLILGIVALVQSKKAGAKNAPALWAIIVSSVLIVVGIIVAIAVISWIATQGGDLVSHLNACLENPAGSFQFNGVTMTCEELLSDSGY